MRWLCMLLFCSLTFAQGRFPIQATELAKAVLVLQRGPWRDMMIIVDAGPSLVVIDTWSSPAAAAIGRTMAERHFGKTVSHVINTHHHWDHVFGNQAFRDAIRVGSRTTVALMKRDYGSPEALRQAMADLRTIDPSPQGQAYAQAVAEENLEALELTVPTRLVDGPEHLRIGTLTFSLLPTPGLHAPSFMLVHVQELGLLVAPKELGLDRPPAGISGQDPANVVACLRRVQKVQPPLRWALLGHFAPIPGPDLDTVIQAWQHMK